MVILGLADWGVSAICPTFKTGVFTHEELERAIKTVQNGKAPGMDEIPNEVLRMRKLRVHILNVLNDALQHGPPQQWKQLLHAYENSTYLQSRISGRMLRYALNAKFCGATKEWTLHTEQLLGPTLPITTQLVRRHLVVVAHPI